VHVSDEGIRLIAEGQWPIREPGELAVDPHADARRVSQGVVFLPYVRIVDIAQVVAAVEIDQ
jgi:hypothetical protein